MKWRGVTAFRLAVDPEGKPIRCDIADSSRFDVLDQATCERLLARAKFAPARNDKDKSGERTYVGRVRWVIPEGAADNPTSEHFGRILFTFDQAGKISSCRMVIEVPTGTGPTPQPPCNHIAESVPPALATTVLGKTAGAPAGGEMLSATAFTPELRARVLAARPGYEQLALSVYRFTVTKDGVLGACKIEEQRGLDSMIANSCQAMTGRRFDPPFSALDKDGVATGWQIIRTLLKTGP